MPYNRSREPGGPVFEFGDKNKYEVCEITGCWIWWGAWNPISHRGNVRDEAGNHIQAYVYFWVKKNGPVPKGKELDHVVCDNPICVNPDHLQLQTRRKNATRGGGHRLARLLGDIPF